MLGLAGHALLLVGILGGTLLLAAPGAWLGGALALAAPAAIAERKWPLAAMRRSWRLSHGVRVRLVVVTRHKGASLFAISSWPVFVHVLRPKIESPELREHLRDDELEPIAWAEFYASEEDARAKALERDG